MARPIPWDGDPPCEHDVTYAYQTHYCTYIRVPRLLSLQAPARPADLLLITAFQWYELWFKVLLTDLCAALAADPATYAPVKLLRRGIELFKLFDQHADLFEGVLLTRPDPRQPLAALPGRLPSAQWTAIHALSRRLPGLASTPALGAPPLGRAEALGEYQRRLKRFHARFREFCRATLLPAAGTVAGYAEWLRLDDLLNLQQAVKSDWTPEGQAPTGFYVPPQVSPDENLFVIVHQAFELWFRVILDHLDRTVAALQADDIATAGRLAGRVAAIQRLLVPQIQMPATMLAPDFMLFRTQKMERDGQVLYTGLTPASGTESYQFREIEIICGLGRDPVFQTYLAGLDSLPVRLLTARQQARLAQITLPEAFRAAATRRGVGNFSELFTISSVANAHLDLALLADSLLEFDEFFRAWRIGHVSMVQKMIGHRSGTGFLGPEYLAETAGLQDQAHNRVFAERQFRGRFFEELWRAREGGK
jgi:tryptophan 2,3-dioxygenase